MPPFWQFWLPMIVAILLAAVAMHPMHQPAIRSGLYVFALMLITATVTWQIASWVMSPAPQVPSAPDVGINKDGEIANLKHENARLRTQLSVRPPSLKIYTSGNSDANGATIEVAVNKEGAFTIPDMVMRNVGGSAAHEFRVRLFLSHPVQTMMSLWQDVKSHEKGFPSQFFFGGPGYTVSPGEPWGIPAFSGKFLGPLPPEMSVRLNVYYGQEKPTTANFRIVTRSAP